MSLFTSYVAEGTVEEGTVEEVTVEVTAMVMGGIGAGGQGILDFGTGGMCQALDTGGTVFMDLDRDGGAMDRIGDLGELIIRIPIMELMVIPIPATDT